MSRRIVVTPQPRPSDVNARLQTLLTGMEQAQSVAAMRAAAANADRVPPTGKP